MRIYFYDGSEMECYKIEIGMYGNLIVDEYRVVPMDEVINIYDD